MTEFFGFGPREWSPRQRIAEKHVVALKAVIPPEMLVEEGAGHHVGDQVYLASLTDQRSAKIALIVRIDNTYEHVHVCSTGRIFIDHGIRMLLSGLNIHYPHLAGRWPWPDNLGPPNPDDPLGRYS